jgi:hypothetical protein
MTYKREVIIPEEEFKKGIEKYDEKEKLEFIYELIPKLKIYFSNSLF